MKRDELGASIVEYALLLLLIAVVAVVVVSQVGTASSSSYGSVIDGFN